MADISKDALRREITAILKDADLTTTSAKKVRQQIEEKLEVNLSDRKKEIDDLVMECLEKKQESGKGKDKDKDAGKKRAHDDDEEEDESEEQEEDEEEEEDSPKQKRTAAAKKPVKRTKRGSSDESDDNSDVRDASDEEYSPTGKKGGGKGSGKKGKGKGGKKKGSDSDNDSDEDWNKTRRAAAPAKKAAGTGAKRGGGGYTRAYTLTPELAAVVGQDSMARHEVVRKVWSIIKERNLYDPKNKQFAICDDELLKVFGVKRFRTFGMMKYLKNHFLE